MTTTLATTPASTLATLDADRLANLAREWVKTYRAANTRAAYGRDLEAWASWCATYGADPLTTDPRALEALANRWRLALEADPDTLADHPGPAPKPLAPTTIARRLSAVSGFYRWATRQGVTQANPLADVPRPVVDDETTMLGPTLAETAAMVMAGRAMGDNTGAILELLAATGLRVSELLSLDVGAATTEAGHLVVAVRGKGGRRRFAPLYPEAVAAVAELEAGRAAGPLVVDSTGRRMTRHQVAHRVRRAAQLAGVTKRLSPHSLRHQWVTTALAEGVPLHVVQDGAGHRSPETTRRYDRQRGALTGHANYRVGAALSRALEAVG
jgi:integrase/recombinase XerD